MAFPLRSRAFGRYCIALALVMASSSAAVAQTNTFSNGSALNVPGLSALATTGSLMGGMQVTWTFVNVGSFSSSWADIGGGNWGVSSNGFSVAVGSNGNTFATVWSLTNATNNRVSSVRFDGVPGNTVFDCFLGVDCTSDTPGSNQGRSLLTTGGTYFGSVSGAYTNRVGVGGNAALGDLYGQLTITFDDILGAQSTYQFIADTDNFVQSIVTPEPGSWELLLVGLAAVGVASHRGRRRLA